MSFNNAKYLKELRKDLRNNLTPAEATLWKYLQNSKLDGKKFRRQHSIGNYILDFYCPSEKLGIEVDGNIHDGFAAQEYDKERTAYLNQLGIKIIRFQNDDIFQTQELIYKKIRSGFSTTPTPP